MGASPELPRASQGRARRAPGRVAAGRKGAGRALGAGGGRGVHRRSGACRRTRLSFPAPLRGGGTVERSRPPRRGGGGIPCRPARAPARAGRAAGGIHRQGDPGPPRRPQAPARARYPGLSGRGARPRRFGVPGGASADERASCPPLSDQGEVPTGAHQPGAQVDIVTASLSDSIRLAGRPRSGDGARLRGQAAAFSGSCPRSARMWSSPMPQQPPMTCTPRPVHDCAAETQSSSVCGFSTLGSAKACT